MCKTRLSFPTDRFNVVLLLQFLLLRASVISSVAFMMSLFVPHLSFLVCLGRAVLCDCSFSWVFLLIFLRNKAGARQIKYPLLKGKSIIYLKFERFGEDGGCRSLHLCP